MSYSQITTEMEIYSDFGARCNPRETRLKVLVGGHEEFTRRELCRILLAEEDVDIIGESADDRDAVDKIVRLQPNLVFLDIERQGFNGFEVIFEVTRKLPLPPAVVLSSALHQHATRAFEANALDFLMKPISADRVKKSLSRARTAVALERKMAGLPEPIGSGEEKKRAPIYRLAVHKGKRVLLLSLKDIYYVTVDNRLVYTFTENEHYLINRTITELDELLQGEGFFQINRGTIINLDYLCEIIPWFSGTFRLKLANGEELPLSRNRVAALKARVGLSRTWSGK